MKREFEIGFMMNPEASDEEVKKLTDSLKLIIENNDGTVEKIDEWGRRKLAYPIEKHEDGIYTFIKCQMNGQGVAEIERRLKLNEKVMRFISVRLDERLKKSNRLTKKWNKMDKFRKARESSRESARESSRESSHDSSRDSGREKVTEKSSEKKEANHGE